MPDPGCAVPPLCLEKRFAMFSRHSIRAVHGRGCVRSFVEDGGVCDADKAEALCSVCRHEQSPSERADIVPTDWRCDDQIQLQLNSGSVRQLSTFTGCEVRPMIARLFKHMDRCCQEPENARGFRCCPLCDKSSCEGLLHQRWLLMRGCSAWGGDRNILLKRHRRSRLSCFACAGVGRHDMKKNECPIMDPNRRFRIRLRPDAMTASNAEKKCGDIMDKKQKKM